MTPRKQTKAKQERIAKLINEIRSLLEWYRVVSDDTTEELLRYLKQLEAEGRK